MPKFPECWESCGNCAAETIIIETLLVAPGERIERDATLLVLETGKVALDIPCPYEGRVVEVFVERYDEVSEGMLLVTVECE
ncbi:biotin/lipoyl-containing protein [Sterolibacterium denitrificans]|nr:biotin/lipoyl-containing protein [Sterolibacterium denitrificans]